MENPYVKFWKQNALAILVCMVILRTVAATVLATNQEEIPTLDAAAGPCRADFTVKDGSGKPIYAAKVDVLIKYGFMDLRNTELQAETNSNGEARFTGLPNFPKKPLQFVIKSGTVSKTITDDPTKTCSGKFDVTLSVE